MDLFRKLHNALKQATTDTPPTPADQAQRLLQRGDDKLALRLPLEAIECYNQAHQIFRQLDDQFHQAVSFGRLGNAYSTMAHRERATEYYQAALAMSHALQEYRLMASALGNLGLLAQTADQAEQALAYFLQVLELVPHLQDTSVQRFTLNNIANTYFDQGEYEQAIAYSEQFIEANQTTDNRRDDAVCLSKMGVAYIHLQQRERGRALLYQAWELLQHSTNPEAQADRVRVQAWLEQLDQGTN